MQQLESFIPGQERYEHECKNFSIMDLTEERKD